MINNEEFLLLYGLNKSSNLELSYWSYDQFDLDFLTDDECKSEFRFYKNDVYLLIVAEVLQVSDQIRCSVFVLKYLHIPVEILICCQDLQAP